MTNLPVRHLESAFAIVGNPKNESQSAGVGITSAFQYAASPRRGYQPSNSQSSLFSAISDIAGKIWTLPNTVLGAIVGTGGWAVGNVGYALGVLPNQPKITFGNNAIQFLNLPFGSGALTLGNAVLYSGISPNSNTTYGEVGVNTGLHEKAHTFQAQRLGPFYLLGYIFSGPIADVNRNPFESSAQNYGRSKGADSYWPNGN